MLLDIFLVDVTRVRCVARLITRVGKKVDRLVTAHVICCVTRLVKSADECVISTMTTIEARKALGDVFEGMDKGFFWNDRNWVT